MAIYNFETITDAQAAGFTAADTLIFGQTGETANTTTVMVSKLKIAIYLSSRVSQEPLERLTPIPDGAVPAVQHPKHHSMAAA